MKREAIRTGKYGFRSAAGKILLIGSVRMAEYIRRGDEGDAVAAYCFIDPECGLSFLTVGTGDFRTCRILSDDAAAIIFRMSQVEEKPAYLHGLNLDEFPQIKAPAERYMKKIREPEGLLEFREYGFLDPYRDRHHPDVIRASAEDDPQIVLSVHIHDMEDGLLRGTLKHVPEGYTGLMKGEEVMVTAEDGPGMQRVFMKKIR